MEFRLITLYRYAAILILAFIVFYTANYEGKIAIDTKSYVEVANKGFDSEWLGTRPWGYPLLIRFSGFISNDPYPVVVIIQCLFYILSFSLLIFYCSKVERFRNSKAAIVVLFIAFASPQSINYLSVIIPEAIPLFFILLAIIFTYKNISNAKQIILYAIFITIPILFKPLWLYLLLLPVSKLIIYRDNLRTISFNCILPLLLSLTFYSFHTVLNKTYSTGNILASTLDVNINLTLIRYGLISGSEGTSLYQYIDSLQLVEEIEKREWNVLSEDEAEFEHFTELKGKIPFRTREDKQFWRNILSQPDNLFKFLSSQLLRVPYFFTTSGSNSHVDLEFPLLNYIYQTFYHYIHKILILPLFILFTIRLLKCLFKGKINDFFIYFIPWMVIMGGAVVLSLLTYQNAHFFRMRILLEIILLIVCFGELAYWVKFLFYKFINYRKSVFREQTN